MIVIHPSDPTTDCLKSVYEGLHEVTLFTDYRKRDEILSAIERAPKDELICFLGHGTPRGLVYRDEDRMSFLFTEKDVHLLEGRNNVIGIWCYASYFARENKVRGLFSGMFISEPQEAVYCDVEAEDDEIETENMRFSKMLGDCLKKGLSLKQTFDVLKDPQNQYSPLTEYNYSKFKYFTDDTFILRSLQG